MSLTEIGKAIGVYPSTVKRWKNRGCPVDSVDSVRRWVDENIRYNGGRPRGSRVKAAEEPVPVVAAESNGTAARTEPNGSKVAAALEATTGPDELLRRYAHVERAAFSRWVTALQSQSSTAGTALREADAATRNYLMIRDKCLHAAERERSLVSGEWVRRAIAEHDGLITNLIRAMPRQMAPRLCPHDPEFAERELATWVNDSFLKTMHSTDPFNGK
jgi:hypothetical protein